MLHRLPIDSSTSAVKFMGFHRCKDILRVPTEVMKRQSRIEKAKTSLFPKVRGSCLCRVHCILTEMPKTMRKIPKKRVSRMKPRKFPADKEIIFRRRGNRQGERVPKHVGGCVI